jgi:hypothetical protein
VLSQGEVDMTAVKAVEEPVRRLNRSLKLFDSTMLVAGSMIGSGIFLVTAQMTRELGSAGWLLAFWVITAETSRAGRSDRAGPYGRHNSVAIHLNFSHPFRTSSSSLALEWVAQVSKARRGPPT